MTAPASIVIPTRARPDYLEIALSSIVPQAAAAGAEVLVIDDAGPSPAMRALVERLGARYEPHPGPLGLNVARNTGVERSTGELVVFVDDDVRVRPGWFTLQRPQPGAQRASSHLRRASPTSGDPSPAMVSARSQAESRRGVFGWRRSARAERSSPCRTCL